MVGPHEGQMSRQRNVESGSNVGLTRVDLGPVSGAITGAQRAIHVRAKRVDLVGYGLSCGGLTAGTTYLTIIMSTTPLAGNVSLTDPTQTGADFLVDSTKTLTTTGNLFRRFPVSRYKVTAAGTAQASANASTDDPTIPFCTIGLRLVVTGGGTITDGWGFVYFRVWDDADM